jgi:nitrate reductase NapE component
MFQTLQKWFKKYIFIAMARNNYLKLDKVTLAEWVDKALLQSLKKEIIKLGFKVCKNWPLNLVAMVGKFGLSKVFIATEKEKVENAY